MRLLICTLFLALPLLIVGVGCSGGPTTQAVNAVEAKPGQKIEKSKVMNEQSKAYIPAPPSK